MYYYAPYETEYLTKGTVTKNIVMQLSHFFPMLFGSIIIILCKPQLHFMIDENVISQQIEHMQADTWGKFKQFIDGIQNVFIFYWAISESYFQP